MAILFLPGTILHEVAHYLTAHILFVPTGKMELIPEMQDHSTVKLGSVQIAKTDPFRRALIGFAPFFYGVGVILLVLWYVYSSNLLTYTPILIIAGYIIFEVGNTMFSSKKDLEGTLELLIALAVIVGILYFVGIRVPGSIFTSLFTDQVVTFLMLCCQFILVPLGIDVVALLVLALIKRILLQ
jgi:hypothetical protein